MAVLIGRTPAWGTQPTQGTLATALIVTGLDYSPTVKEYEQVDENGSVCGWRGYDQQTEVSISGNAVFTEGNTDINYTMLQPATILDATTGGIDLAAIQALGNTNLIADSSVVSVVAKSPSISRTNDGAASVSISATAYYFV